MKIKYRLERMTKAEISKRDNDLVKDYNDSMPISEIAKKYNISTQRMYKILEKFDK